MAPAFYHPSQKSRAVPKVSQQPPPYHGYFHRPTRPSLNTPNDSTVKGLITSSVNNCLPIRSILEKNLEFNHQNNDYQMYRNTSQTGAHGIRPSVPLQIRDSYGRSYGYPNQSVVNRDVHSNYYAKQNQHIPQKFPIQHRNPNFKYPAKFNTGYTNSWHRPQYECGESSGQNGASQFDSSLSQNANYHVSNGSSSHSNTHRTACANPTNSYLSLIHI